MSSIEQAAKDLAVADTYVNNLEKQLGKKTSATMRKMLRDAVMAGIKHGRETADSDALSSLLGGGKRPFG